MNNQPPLGIDDMSDTKLKVFLSAIDLFYEKGYSSVGMRDIALAVGIKSASIYNHFTSKNDIMERIYEFFYDNYEANLPDIDVIVALIPETPPHEVFERLQMPLQSGGTYEILKKVIMIAEYECNNDDRAQAIVTDMFAAYTRRIASALDKMIEKNIIKPIDVDLFASVLARFGLSSASRVESLRNLSVAEWRSAHRMLFGLVKKS